MTKVLNKIKPLIDKTIKELFEKKDFEVDPILGKRFGLQTSILSSAQKRHGLIIESAMLEYAKTIESIKAWEDRDFYIHDQVSPIVEVFLSHELMNQAKEKGVEAEQVKSAIKEQEIKYYTPETGPTFAFKKNQLDLLVYDKEKRSLNCYEIKRGNSAHDSQKKKEMLKTLWSTQFLLKSYGEFHGLKVDSVKAYCIFYYGKGGLGKEGNKEFRLKGDEIDEHFGHPFCKEVDAATDYFRDSLWKKLSSI